MLFTRELAQALVDDRLREAERWRRARRARFTRRPVPEPPAKATDA
jgi:hypothetical protein